MLGSAESGRCSFAGDRGLADSASPSASLTVDGPPGGVGRVRRWPTARSDRRAGIATTSASVDDSEREVRRRVRFCVSQGVGSVGGVGQRWSVEQVESIAPNPAAVTAAQPLATSTRWGGLGADDRVLWGSCQGSGNEPYDTMVDHVGVGFRCTCPSRRVPCKHALALLLLWARGQVPEGVPAAPLEAWIARRVEASAPHTAPGHDADRSQPGDTVASSGRDGAPGSDASATDPAGEADDDATPPEPPDDDERDAARDERVEKMMAGLTELDRWLDDRIRTGLADPALARYATWDQLAARLVDARAGSLANRIRRLAGLVGASPDWHDDVLAELGILHLLSQAGRRIRDLPGPLADAVATTVGWQVRKADVLGGVPDTDTWIVAGRSDTREDRIEVRRHWLQGTESGRWALLLSFAAYQQSLDTSLEVGTAVHADLHRYPGPALRALMGRRYGEATIDGPPALTVAAACDEVGQMVAAEPWLERVPATLRATPTRDGERWVLGDETGTLPLLLPERRSPVESGLATLLAVSGGRAVDVTVEWTPHGIVALSIHLPDRTLDIGPRADASFVGAA